VAFVNIPKFYFPKPLPDPNTLKSHPWQLCGECQYLLCSCGNCHNSELCNQPCSHDDPGSEAGDDAVQVTDAMASLLRNRVE
jgi:hypothetical protein